MIIDEAIIFGKKEISNIMESRILLSHSAKISIEEILGYPKRKLSAENQALFREYIARRKSGEPIAYILGYKEFYGRDFFVDRNVLIPRNDSETMIDAVLKSKDSNKKYQILELGTGSGCLIITLLLELLNSEAIGVDIDPKAVQIAQKNIAKYNLENRCKISISNWFDKILPSQKFDLIISNPPYISLSEKNIMSEETKLFEPKIALYAQNDGLEHYETIAKNAANFMTEDAKIFLEIGIGQSKKITDIFLQQGFDLLEEYKDLGGIIRILEFTVRKS